MPNPSDIGRDVPSSFDPKSRDETSPPLSELLEIGGLMQPWQLEDAVATSNSILTGTFFSTLAPSFYFSPNTIGYSLAVNHSVMKKPFLRIKPALVAATPPFSLLHILAQVAQVFSLALAVVAPALACAATAPGPNRPLGRHHQTPHHRAGHPRGP